MRTALRVGAIGAIVLAVAAGVVFVTQRDKLLAHLGASLTDTLSAQLGGRIDLGRIHLDVVPFTVVIEGLTVHSPSEAIPAPPLSVDRITARPSLISFLTRTPVIRWLRVEHPRIEVVATEGGPANLPRAGGAAAPGGGGPAVLIKRIDIEDAEAIYRSPTASVSLKGVDAVLYPDLVTGHVKADLSVSGGTATVGGRSVPFGKGRLQFVIEGRRITIADFSLDGTGISLFAKGTVALDDAPAFDLSASGSVDLQPLLATWAASPSVTGRVSARARVSGRLEQPSLRGDFAAQRITFRGIPIGDLSGNVDFRDGRLAVTDAAGQVLGGAIRGRGAVDLGATPMAWSAETDASRLRPSPLLQHLAAFPTPLPAPEISGPIALQGRGISLETLDGKGHLAITMPRPEGDAAAPTAMGRVRALIQLIVSADVPWTLHAGRLGLDATLATESGRLSVAGSVTAGGEADLALSATGQDVAAVTNALALPFSAGGVGAFRGRLTGQLTDPVVEGRGDIHALSVRGHPAGDLATTLHYAERTVSFRETVWRNGDARYDTVGKLTWQGESVPGFDLTSTLQGARVEDVLPIAFAPLPIRARADGTFRFQGAPADFLISGDLRLGEGSIWGQSFERGAVRMAIEPHRITFPRAALHRGESEVRGHGSIDFHGGFEAQFEAPTVHLQTLDLFALNDLPISGVASASLAMKGTFDKPEMHGSAAIEYLEGAGQSLGRGRATLDVAEHRLALNAALEDQHAELDAVLLWKPQFPISAVLTIDNSSLVPLLRPWLPAAIADMNAALSGRIAVDGPLLQPLDWRVDARLTRLSADVGEYVVENQDDLVLTMDRGRVSVGACRLRGTDTTLTVSGSVDLFKAYDLLIIGEADLRLTRLFVPTVTSGRGKTYLVLKISDRWASPKIQGGVTIQSAVIRTRALKQPITVDTVGLFFSERQVVLESLEGSLGNGHVSASGQIQLTGFLPSRFGVLIDLFGVQFPLSEDLTPTFSGQLVLTGTPDGQSLRGELTIDRAVYSTRVNVQDRLLDLRRRAEEQSAAPETPALARGLSLNIHFTGRDHIAIKNNLADSALEVDLTLKGTVDHPYLIGRIETREATLRFSGNIFEVQVATLDFVNTTRFLPVLDLQATTKVQDYDITLHIAGTIEHFDLGLTSDPSLSETDILALLTMGRTTEQVSKSEQSVGKEEATSMAMQQLLETGVEKLPGIDQVVDSFQFSPVYDPTLNTSATELSVGKQLFENKLVLRYSTTLESSARQGVRVEYELSRNVYLIGEQDSQRGFGGDIRFRFEFR